MSCEAVIKKLSDREKQCEQEKLQSLWKDSFDDEDAYVYYYFTTCYYEGDCYVLYIKNRLVSCIYVNYRECFLYGKIERIPYIVGVATRREEQKKGYMKQLFSFVLEQLKEQKPKFVLLMTEQKALYSWAGFAPIKKEKYIEIVVDAIGIENKDRTYEFLQNRDWDEICPLSRQNCQELSDFSNRFLQCRFDFFTHRTPRYYERLQKEYHSQNGEILLYLKECRCVGYLYYGVEKNRVIVQEIEGIPPKEQMLNGFLQYLCAVKQVSEIPLISEKELPVLMMKTWKEFSLNPDRILFKDWD